MYLIIINFIKDDILNDTFKTIVCVISVKLYTVDHCNWPALWCEEEVLSQLNIDERAGDNTICGSINQLSCYLIFTL